MLALSLYIKTTLETTARNSYAVASGSQNFCLPSCQGMVQKTAKIVFSSLGDKIIQITKSLVWIKQLENALRAKWDAYNMEICLNYLKFRSQIDCNFTVMCSFFFGQTLCKISEYVLIELLIFIYYNTLLYVGYRSVVLGIRSVLTRKYVVQLQ